MNAGKPDTLQEREVSCPYCGEVFTSMLDASAGDQEYIEDCPVCCQPIEFHLRVEPAGITVTLRTQDES